MMPNADGSVTIRADLDNSQLEKEYEKTVRKIGEMERDISAKKARRASHEQDSLGLKSQLDAASKKLHDLRMEAVKGNMTGDAVKAQGSAVSSLMEQWSEAQSQVEKYDKEIASATEKLEVQKAKAAELADEIEHSSNSANKLDYSFDGVEKRLDQLTKRMSKLASRVLIFSALASVLRSFRDYMGDVVSSNDEASASLARLKGALLTMIQPLTSVILPAFTAFVNILTAVIGKIASFIAILGGSTAKGASDAAKALDAETKALNSAGAAAKKASRDLAGFDEINRLGDTNTGGGGGSSSTVEPDFSWSDGVTEDLSRIADYILLIGTGLALWKIGDKLPGTLGTIATTLAGVLITLGGLLMLWDGINDAWENGVDWANLTEMIVGLAAAAGGLYIAFGPVAAGIGLVAGGLALLVTGFHDAMESGFNLTNTLLTVAGIVAAGLGITLLTHSLIPLLVGSIAGLLVALTVATGNSEELIQGVQNICQGFVDFFTGIFSGDIEKALGGIETMFDGMGQVVGSVVKGCRDTILSFLDWLDEKTGGKLSWIIDAAKELVTDFFDGILESGSKSIEDLKQIFTGLVTFITGVLTGDWEMAWEGLKDVFKGVLNGIVSVLEGCMNLIVDGINWVLKQINKISITIPSWVPGIGGSYFGPNIDLLDHYELPRLAQGAVLPANKPFLAMVGDQKHGTNVEAPLSTIQEAVAIVMDDMVGGMMAGFEALLEENRLLRETVESMEIGDETIAKANKRYQETMAIVRGGV